MSRPIPRPAPVTNATLGSDMARILADPVTAENPQRSQIGSGNLRFSGGLALIRGARGWMLTEVAHHISPPGCSTRWMFYALKDGP
jgi:hypothetical protein